MKIIVSLIILGLVLFSASADAQTHKRKKNSKTKTVKTIPPIVSAHNLGEKAINSVAPVFPQMARTANVYGSVSVKVLIDETGAVISAEAISGHTLLRGASVRAALESKFQPMTLSGNPVRMSGFIVYYFIPNQWNWLEIGYVFNYISGYYNIKSLSDLFPSGYSDEKQLLQQNYAEIERNRDFLQTAIASIQSKLSGNEKDLWLFSVGLWLGKVNGWNWNDSQKQDLIRQLNILIISKPETAKPDLVTLLKKVVLYLEKLNVKIYDSEIYPLLKDAENKFPFWGR